MLPSSREPSHADEIGAYAGEGFGVRVATTVWYLWLALVSYRLLRIADKAEVMASSAQAAA